MPARAITQALRKGPGGASGSVTTIAIASSALVFGYVGFGPGLFNLLPARVSMHGAARWDPVGGFEAAPDAIRKLGGALFCDRRYDHVFIYHNGADSYYAARGFRGLLRV